MPLPVSGTGRGGGTPAAPPGDGGDPNAALSRLISDNPRPLSLRPGMVLTGVVNKAGGVGYHYVPPPPSGATRITEVGFTRVLNDGTTIRVLE